MAALDFNHVAFLRPVVITDPNDHFEYKFDGGAWHDINLTNGTYACILTLLREIQNKIRTAIAPDVVSCYLYTNPAHHSLKIVIWKSSTTSQELKFAAGETDLRNMLGFIANQPDGSPDDGYPTLASLIPPDQASNYFISDINIGNAWLPYRVPDDREGWIEDRKSCFKGVKVANGQLVGIGVPAVFAERDFSFPMEPAENVKIESATEYQFAAARCAETFSKECRVAQIEESTQCNPRGMWFYPVKTAEEYHNGPYTTLMAADTGINYRYATDPDRYAYCVLDPSGMNFSIAMSRGRAYYNVEFSASVADIPSFVAVGAS